MAREAPQIRLPTAQQTWVAINRAADRISDLLPTVTRNVCGARIRSDRLPTADKYRPFRPADLPVRRLPEAVLRSGGVKFGAGQIAGPCRRTAREWACRTAALAAPPLTPRSKDLAGAWPRNMEIAARSTVSAQVCCFDVTVGGGVRRRLRC